MIALALSAALLLNPAVTQANIHDTICRPGWSKSVRPPRQWSSRIKRQLLPSGGEMRDYVLDHIEPISLGGAPGDRRNLQLQTRADSARKDRVEEELHNAVCAGRMSLHDAQHQMDAWR